MALFRNELEPVPQAYSWNLTAICLIVLIAFACFALWMVPQPWGFYGFGGTGGGMFNTTPAQGMLPALP
jgi:hypothetical protein